MNKWLLFAFVWFSGSLYALFFRDGGTSPPPFVHFDKIAHMGLFFGQFWLLAKIFIETDKPVPWRGLLTAAVFWAAVSEVLQALFTRNRQGDVWDAATDVLGAVLAVYLAYRVQSAGKASGGNFS
ncbi:VanZ family protein [Stenoxybacter acetivorans]|uniref:VanZ family protein n=1 Tax=Stenoxybacter acetivorans TaxID=422441 RepID=UPI00056790E9|nr:VanZ family protein [Stenoxybacter acetivorans]